MANGISIAIASETREYAQGIQRGVIEPSQDALQALEDLGRDDAGEQLTRSMRTAQRGTEELRTDIGRLSREVQESGRKGRQVGVDYQHGMKEASEGVDTAKENIRSNAKEIAASFDGSVEGAVGGVQGLVAEVLEGFGPGGLIAGAVLAGGIGLLTTAIQGAQEETEEFRADVAQLAATWIDAGRNGKVSTQEIADGIKALATETDGSKASLEDVGKQADALGIPFEKLARIYAAGGDATRRVIELTQQQVKAATELTDANDLQMRGVIVSGGVFGIDAQKRAALLQAQVEKLKGVQRETDEAAKREQAWLAAGGPDLELKAERTQDYAEGIQSALHDAGADWETYKTKEGGVDLAAYEKGLRAKVRATERYNANLGTLAAKGNADALGYIESLGQDAAPLLQAFVDAPKDKQTSLMAAWAQLGRAASSSFKTQLEQGIPQVIPGPTLAPVDSQAYLSSVRSVRQAGQDYLDRNPLSQSFARRTGVPQP